MEIHLVRVDLVAVGTLAADVARLTADYERRLSRYVKLTIHELKAEPTKRGEQVVLRAEAERLTALLDRLAAATDQPTTVCVLDSRGEQPSTEQLAARWLGARHLVLVIGGTMGLASEVAARATQTVSFGRITLPHQLARLIATEQLYRSFRIARGEPYHF